MADKEDMPVDVRKQDYLNGRTREVFNALRRQHYHANRERLLEARRLKETETNRLKLWHREYYVKNKERLNAQSRSNWHNPKNKLRNEKYRQKWIEKNPLASTANNLARYGVTLDDYEKRYFKQSGVCAICERPERLIDPRSKEPRRLAVDHNHRTGFVRGLLCSSCNAGIGRFGDDPNRLIAAAKYLRRPVAIILDLANAVYTPQARSTATGDLLLDLFS